MRKKLSCLTICVLLLATFFTIDLSFKVVQNAEAPGPITIYVDDDAPNDPGPNDSSVSDPLEDGSLDHPFDYIPEGVGAANNGDTVFVFNGTYWRGGGIHKTISIVGENMNTTRVINPLYDNMMGSAFGVYADWVNITGFTMRRGYDYTVFLIGSSNVTISGNIICDTGGAGIYVDNVSTDVEISENILYNNTWNIQLNGYSTPAPDTNIYIFRNIINDSAQSGILLEYNHNNTIENNTFINSSIYLHHADNNYIGFNNLSFSGINLRHECDGNKIIGNRISDSWDGIRVTEHSYSNNISGNYIINCQNGIYSELNCDDSIVAYNHVISNSMYGIGILADFRNSVIHHNNIIKNRFQAYGGWEANWDNGYPSGGNFWSDYDGVDFFSGPNQDIPGSDGIGDTPYAPGASFQDNYPLMEPIGHFLHFSSGWNFVSIPNELPYSDASKILDSIKDNYSALQYYDSSDALDPWKHYHRDKPSELNDLQEIDHHGGFWIKVTEPKGIFYESLGTPPQANQSIQLYEGWNMVGYPSYSKYNRTEGLNNLVFGSDVNAVWTFNARAKIWEEVGESNYYVKGHGYWIHATTDCVWEVPL